MAGKRTIDRALAALPVEQLVSALLAQRYATAVDRAARAEDDARLVAAGEKLRAVLASLEPVKAKTPGGGSPDDGSTGTRGRVAELFSDRPTMGHAANA